MIVWVGRDELEIEDTGTGGISYFGVSFENLDRPRSFLDLVVTNSL